MIIEPKEREKIFIFLDGFDTCVNEAFSSLISTTEEEGKKFDGAFHKKKNCVTFNVGHSLLDFTRFFGRFSTPFVPLLHLPLFSIVVVLSFVWVYMKFSNYYII